jgi:hypothetical protein
MKQHPLGAADMVRALATLKPRDENTRRAIAGMLGFDLVAAASDGSEPDEVAQPKSSPRIRPPPPAPDMGREAAPVEQAFDLSPQQPQDWSVKAQPPTEAGVEALSQGAPEDRLPPLPFEPLLRRSGERAVVSTMLRTRRRSGPPVIFDLVRAAAQMKPLSGVPGSWQDSLHGADVLVDVGDSMVVFGRDQEWLTSLIRRVVGDDRIRVFSFSGSPAQGVTSEDEPLPGPYAPPPGRPILMLTDLGIGAEPSGDAAPASEWRDFARRMRTARCHLIALVPYPRSRWPRDVPPTLHIVQWDRATGVGGVRSVLGRLSGA